MIPFDPSTLSMGMFGRLVIQDITMFVVLKLIQTRFIFWQQTADSLLGQHFCQFYHSCLKFPGIWFILSPFISGYYCYFKHVLIVFLFSIAYKPAIFIMSPLVKNAMQIWYGNILVNDIIAQGIFLSVIVFADARTCSHCCLYA